MRHVSANDFLCLRVAPGCRRFLDALRPLAPRSSPWRSRACAWAATWPCPAARCTTRWAATSRSGCLYERGTLHCGASADEIRPVLTEAADAQQWAGEYTSHISWHDEETAGTTRPVHQMGGQVVRDGHRVDAPMILCIVRGHGRFGLAGIWGRWAWSSGEVQSQLAKVVVQEACKQKRPACAGLEESLERTTGLEPATPTLARLCSTN